MPRCWPSADARGDRESETACRIRGSRAPWGFTNPSITRESEPKGERGVVIYAYMAHHQGMSLVALDNALQGRIMQRRFHHDLRIRRHPVACFSSGSRSRDCR